nr:hypothetical protein [Denitromonas iodatirespirans]
MLKPRRRIDRDAAFTDAKRSFRMQSELASLHCIAIGFVINATIVGIERKPHLPVTEEIPERTEQAARLAIEDEVGTWRDWADTGMTGELPPVRMVATAEKAAKACPRQRSSLIGSPFNANVQSINAIVL